MLSFQEFITEQQELNEAITNPVFSGDKEITQFDKNFSKKSKADLVNDLSNIYNKYAKKFESVLKQFQQRVKREISGNNKVKFLSNIKEFKSVVDKVIDRKKDMKSINDYVRGAVLFPSKEEADKFVKDFLRKNKSIVVGYEEKKRGQDRTYGYYGSHHIDINIDGVIVEMQIMSKKLWNYKHEAHKIYTSTRSKADGPDRFEKHTSNRIFSIANESLENVELEFTTEELDDFCPELYKEVL